MKKSLKCLMSLFLILFLSSTLVAANPSENDQQSIDAFNPVLEQEKLNEIFKQNSPASSSMEPGDRILIDPDNPLVLTFDDGSTITYTAEIIYDNDSDNSPASGNDLQFRMGKNYSWGIFGHASIIHVIDNCARSSGFPTVITCSSDPRDTWQEYTTNFATVGNTSQRFKYINFALTNVGLRAEASGDISYNIAGVTGQESYRFAWEVEPTTFDMYFVPSY